MRRKYKKSQRSKLASTSSIIPSEGFNKKKSGYDEERYRVIEEIKRQRVLNDIEKNVQEKGIAVVEN
jgi:hypothetical protein